MGLLTDPSAGRGKLTQMLLKYYLKFCFVMYLSAIIWFCLLAHAPINNSTYFSENALLPGLVKSEFRDDSSAKQFYYELIDEMNMHKDSIPYSWLLAKFRQIGLDAYTHNFTLNYPLGKPQKFTGKNVYGILRAARAASTEALVLSVPFRPITSIHLQTAPSIAIMLTFAKFANKEKYWSKDIIFLVTEHEQLGIQAWLEAYHSTNCGRKGVLDHGDLRGRAGAIQAAINLELHDINIGNIDIKVEGLNGQLPNLDLVNLANRICVKEGVQQTFKNRQARNFKGPFFNWKYSFTTLMAMVTTQATGIPNGNHGLFHRFGIEAITMEGFTPEKVNQRNTASFLYIGRILEGIFRSLNNLLERFHQSFFFYLLPASDRFISIGLYIPVIVLLSGSLYIKACALWFQLQENPLASDNNTEGEEEVDPEEKEEEEAEETEEDEEDEMEEVDLDGSKKKGFKLMEIGLTFLVTHALGVVILNSPYLLSKVGIHWYGLASDTSVFVGFLAISILLLATPFFVRSSLCDRSMTVLNIIAHLEYGTLFLALAMHNFSLALYCSIFYVPVILGISQNRNRFMRGMLRLLWLLLHPLVALIVVVLIYTFCMFPNEPSLETFRRGIGAVPPALMFGIVDSMIYGNWLFSVATFIMLPSWLCGWCILLAKKPEEELVQETVSQEKKTN